MIRDLAMIFSVLLSIVSLGFGVYKNIEAGNAKGFVYEQSYRLMNALNSANLDAQTRAHIIDSALGALRTPPPVLDLSRSSADAPTQAPVCSENIVKSCIDLAGQLGTLNAACVKAKGVGSDCVQADQLKLTIDGLGCFTCFTY